MQINQQRGDKSAGKMFNQDNGETVFMLVSGSLSNIQRDSNYPRTIVRLFDEILKILQPNTRYIKSRHFIHRNSKSVRVCRMNCYFQPSAGDIELHN